MTGDVCILADDQSSLTKEDDNKLFQNSGRQVNGFSNVWQQMVRAQARTSESKPDLQFQKYGQSRDLVAENKLQDMEQRSILKDLAKLLDPGEKFRVN